MQFFPPRPEPSSPSAAEQSFYAYPWQEPENALPGSSGVGITLVRTDTTALRLALEGSYPQGLALTVRGRLHPDHVPDLSWGPPHPGLLGDLRIGLEWPDGRRCEADDQWGPPFKDERPDGYRLTSQGGGGGGLTYTWKLWLWPLPPPGPVTVHVLWEQRGIPETATAVDLTPYVTSAADATILWPLPDPPEEPSWLLHTPLTSGSGFSKLSIGPEEQPTEPSRDPL